VERSIGEDLFHASNRVALPRDICLSTRTGEEPDCYVQLHPAALTRVGDGLIRWLASLSKSGSQLNLREFVGFMTQEILLGKAG
jgi:hypothetical protein